MMAELIDRRAVKARTRETLRGAQVSPRAMAALFLALILVMNLVDSFTGLGILSTFVSILITLLGLVLEAGFVLYCMAVRRGERAEFLTLFDGFSFAGKVIGLCLLKYIFIFLWSLLFTIPGIVAIYRYRFALYNLYENPELSVFQALDMSKRQTMGYKGQLFTLDLSYLGWGLLASIPSLIYSVAFYQIMFEEAMAFYGLPVITASGWAEALIYLLPAWGWTLVMGLWHLAVAIFYLPHYQCVDLGYFETAKTTSGVGEGVVPREDAAPWGRRGPDDLGGF